MSERERQELSSFIKHVHRSLRTQSLKLGPEKAWISHCLDDETLSKYAESMQTLATVYWENCSTTEEILANSRIQWIVNQCRNYFYEGGLEKQRQREQKILSMLQNAYKSDILIFDNIIKLLDVGSCYNPFKKYDFFDVLAIDIAPANEDVFKCDFTALNIVSVEPNQITNNIITDLLKESLHVVVFSLLLDYLPSPDLRLKSCEKAYSLLKTEGILIIVSPDSKHVGANARLMKNWRYTLSSIGFSRIKYEKLSHMHCMVFRKSICPKVPQRWAEIHENEGLKLGLNIPQDFTTDLENEDNVNEFVIREDPKEILNIFQELPDL